MKPVFTLRRCIHQLCRLLHDDEEIVWSRDWTDLLILTLIMLLTGVMLVLADAIQRWNTTTNQWDAKSHWQGTREFAWTLGSADALLFLASIRFPFLIPFSWLTTSTRWSWPFVHLLFWYLLCAMLSPAIAIWLERVNPQTPRIQRVRLASECSAAQSATIVETPTPKKSPRPDKRSTRASKKKKVTNKHDRQMNGMQESRQPSDDDGQVVASREKEDELRSPRGSNEHEIGTSADEHSPAPVPSVPSMPSEPMASPRHQPESLDTLF